MRLIDPSLRRLLGLVGPLGPLVAASTALRVVSLGGTMVLAAGCAFVVGTVIEAQTLDGTMWAVVLGVVALVKALARYGEQVLGHAVAFRLLAEMRSKAYRSLEAQAPAFPGDEQSGEVVSRLTSDVDRIEVFYAHTIGPVVALAVLGPVAALGALLGAGWGAGALVAAGLTLVGLVIPGAAYALGLKKGDELRSLVAQTSAMVQENLRGAEQIHLLGAAGARRVELEALDQGRLGLEDHLGRIAGVKDGLVDVVGWGLLGALAWVSLGALPLGSALALVAWAAAALVPALGVGRAFDDLPETLASARRYFDLIDRPPMVGFSGAGWGGVVDGELGFRGVEFGYGPRPVVRGFDLAVAPGQHVVVAGPSGVGKSTVLRLAARFFDPHSGRVTWAGRPLSQALEDELHATVGYLGQDAYVFSGTLGDNLRLTSPGVDDQKLNEVLDRVGLWTGVEGRLSRDVGTRGDRLSGGERRRLALARLLLQDTPLVVLDEAFSSLDPRGRRVLRDELLATLGGKSVLEATHEAEDADQADRVVVLSNP